MGELADPFHVGCKSWLWVWCVTLSSQSQSHHIGWRCLQPQSGTKSVESKIKINSSDVWSLGFFKASYFSPATPLICSLAHDLILNFSGKHKAILELLITMWKSWHRHKTNSQFELRYIVWDCVILMIKNATGVQLHYHLSLTRWCHCTNLFSPQCLVTTTPPPCTV